MLHSDSAGKRPTFKAGVMRDPGELGVFGGRPLFESPRSVGQLAMPDQRAFLATLRQTFERGKLSDNRPLVATLENRLREFHCVRNCVAVANAGLGITMLMRIFAGGRRGEVVMPAFSYRGLPHFAQWAGQTPHFADVEFDTHGLDPAGLGVNGRTTAVLAVNNFNAPCHIDGILEMTSAYGIPVFFDSVYGLASTYHGKPLGANGDAEVFSMHATKLLNGFEGGYITTNNDDLAAHLREMRSTGFNASLSEVHAAMALHCLDDLDEVIQRNEARYRAYERLIGGIDCISILSYHNERQERHNFEMVVVEVGDQWPLTRDETVRVLRAENIAIVAYYSPPLHRSSHCPDGVVAPSLPVSEDLARRFLQLPVGELTTMEDIERIGAFLVALRERGASIAKRLREAAV
jgi:dTDP-4-amino-4,6-dideoxyglucose